MSFRISRMLALVAIVAALVSFGTPAMAQQYTGRIEVTVEDSTGGRLPGVTVELTGVQNQSAVTDARGEAKFLNLPVGRYNVKAALTGFSDWKSADLTVQAGVAIPLGVKMGVAGAREEVVVTAEAPVLDNKKQTTATSIGLDELQGVPTARDPWVVLQSVPGITMDRVNVGGSESGQQAGFLGKGTDAGQTTWNVDGMPLTDMSSLSSPFYYDFDMFQEMSVVTGGADPKSATGGIQFNFMLKSGTNAFHGSAKGYYETEGMQSTNLPEELFYLSAKDPVTGQPTGKGNRTQQFTDWGGELGGPILKDHWWFWVSYGKQDIRILTINGTRDRTILPNLSFKTQGQITKSMRGSFTFFQANKQKFGRNASVTRPQETTWNQDGPNSMYKGEINYNVGNNLFLVGRYAYTKGGFTFDPQGGMDVDVYRDAGGVYHNSYYNYITDRPQSALVTDGNYFKGNHEIKFGFTWRKTEVHSTSQWPGSMMRTVFDQGSDTLATGLVVAPYASDGSSKYINLYIGDTIAMKRATLNFGLRYDHQSAAVLPSSTAAVPGFEKYLPAVTAPGVDNALSFNNWQPRVGLTYALDNSRKTQLRATYAMFTDQIGSGTAGFLSVAQYRYLYYDVKVAPGQTIATPANIVGGIDNFWGYGGFDPDNPTGAATSINKVGDYGSSRTHEFIIGVDREIMPNLGVSASYTYRSSGNFNWRPTMKANKTDFITGADYVELGSITFPAPNVEGATQQTYTVPYYGITNSAVYDPAKGQIYSTREGYTQNYQGFEASATKRMSNKWMARVGFSTNSWTESWDSLSAIGNPTHSPANPNFSGGDVTLQATSSGKSGIYMSQPKYQFVANGAYQFPYQIDFGLSYLLRQGYAMPWYKTTTRTGNLLAQTQTILLPPSFTQDRLPAVQTLDMRIGKTMKFSAVTMNLDFDIFNLFNSATVLKRTYDGNLTSATTGYGQVTEIMQPRIARLGLRITF